MVPSEAETIHLLYYQGLAYQQLGDAGQARTAFEKVTTTWGDLNGTYYQALACLGLGDLVGGRSALTQALALNPANLFAYEELKRLEPRSG